MQKYLQKDAKSLSRSLFRRLTVEVDQFDFAKKLQVRERGS